MDTGDDPIEGISAVTMVTTDMAASVAFYQALGFALVSGGTHDTFTTFRAGDGFVNLAYDARWRPPGVGWGRVIIYVDDVDAMHARARAAGLRPETEPADASWGERYFHLRDPDAHELSFARPLHTSGNGPAD